MNPITIRLLNQQMIAPQYSTPEEMVSHFGAIQAQEYRMMRWAVEMRTKRPPEKAFTKAFNEGKIVTTPLITHRFPLSKIEEAYRIFENKEDGVIKIAIYNE